MKRYDPKSIEPRWQKFWDEQQTYKADLNSDKPKYLAMSMFNYPSGAGIHIGHAMNYTISDVMARFMRQQGFESYHPVGWDAFGLPAENFAIKSGVSPQASMAKIIPSYHKQYKAMGWSNDWSKEIATHEPGYYKWTQWIFSQMYKQELAYQDARMQWWCDKCQTVLANEQIVDGKCWRHDGPDDPEVTRREVKQWFFKITDYADELLEATDALDWSESVKVAQKNWIGKSKGAEVTFRVESEKLKVESSNYVSLHGFTATPKDNFHPWVRAELEKVGARVTVPALPNTDKPNANEQASFVLETAKFDEDTVLLGHSYGTVTALKVVEQLKEPIKKLVLVAGFAEPGFLDRERNFEATTDWQFDFEKIKANVKEVVILRATNDSAVPQERSDFLKDKLGGRIVDFQANEDHATGNEEPAILDHLLTTNYQLPASITVFTTRPDTLFGATFLVLAPEHELVNQITSDEQKEAVDIYKAETARKSEIERQASKDKTGVPTGAYAVNPVNGSKIPIWIADYVLVGYGTGAIMAVPAHDERDHEFALKYELPIITVVEPTYGEPAGDDTHKESIYVILRNPATNKVVVLDWGPRQARHGGMMLIGGGLEDGEDHRTAAIREITEETGYKNFSFTSETEFKGHGYFYSNTKNKNMHATGKGLLFDLIDEEQTETNLDEGEKNKFKVTWEPIDRVASLLDDGVHEAMYRTLVLGECYHGEGLMINSGDYNGLTSSEAREKIVAELDQSGTGREKTTYKLRDWSVSRQRYWGAPIPIINCESCGTVLVPDDQLPVVLPELDDFQPSGDGRSALARASDWLKVDCPECGGAAERETDTLDTYICSSWYMLRYLDPHNDQQIFDSSTANKWMPVDFYNGGDHATAHMLYARFVTRFLHKLGLVAQPEPFKRFLFNGKVTAADGTNFSKSKGNGVDPLEIIGQGYGADALRTYLMFAAPLDQWMRWDPQGVPGTYRFLNRVWNIVQEFVETSQDSTDDSDAPLRIIHPAILKVSDDLTEQKYNTAIAAMMKATNELYELKAKSGFVSKNWRFALESLVMLVAPFAPHTAEELWHELGHEDSVNKDNWPVLDKQYLISDTITIVVQVNGKLRAQLELPADVDEATAVEAAKQDDKVKAHLGSEPKKVIYVAGRLINFVV